MGLRNEQVVGYFVKRVTAVANGTNTLAIRQGRLFSYDYPLAWFEHDGVVNVNLALTGKTGEDQSGKRSWDLAMSPSTQRHRTQVQRALASAGYIYVGTIPGQVMVWARPKV